MNKILMLSILVIFAIMAQTVDAATIGCDDYIEAWHYDSNWNLVGYTYVHNFVVESHWGTDNVPNHRVNSWTVCGKVPIA